MAVHSVIAPYNGYAVATSAMGATTWMPGNGNLVANAIPAGAGTKWAYWKFQNAGIPAGETMTGITISGGNDFTVGGGGAGKTRVAGLAYKLARNPSEFNAAAGTQMDSLVGTGTGKTLNAVINPTGFTSNDLINGMYIGIGVGTNSADAADGGGTFRYGALTFVFTTGANQPTPPPSSPNGILTNPVGNQSPGVYPGGQFASLSFKLTAPDFPQTTSLRYDWSFNKIGFTFSNGASSLLQTNTAGGGITNLIGNTGLITVAATVRPGTDVQVRCQVSNVAGASPTGMSLYTPLIVRERKIAYPHEF